MKHIFLLLFFVLSLTGFAQNQVINSIIGDSSWQHTYDQSPSRSENETERIKIHLSFVLKHLQNKIPDIDAKKLASRKTLLQHLEEYINQESFPSNLDYPNERKPCFIDASGNICAVGYLVEKTAGRAETERINQLYQYARIKDIDDANLLAWQKLQA